MYLVKYTFFFYLYNSFLSKYNYYLCFVSEDIGVVRYLFGIIVLVDGDFLFCVDLIFKFMFLVVLLNCFLLGLLGRRVGREDMDEGN